MKRFLTCAALVAAPLLLLPATAHADCDAVGGISSGQTVTCDATSIFDGPDAIETRGIDDGSNNITINVDAGARIDTTGGSDRAIDLDDSTDSTITNAGEILSGDEGIQAGDRLTVTNTGVIEAAEKAIDANGEDVEVFNAAGARITSLTNEGVEANDPGARVENHGMIEGFDDAVQVDEAATIINHGTIRNTQTQADLDADPGLEAQDAIDIDSGSITNTATGRILSTTNAAIDFDAGDAGSTITNAGEISGTIAVNTDDADTAAQTILNAGTLRGTSGTALFLGQGDDVLEMQNGGQIIGGADFGAGMDEMRFAADYTFAAGPFAGGALFDGGADIDVFALLGFTRSEVIVSAFSGGDLTLEVAGAALNLTNWERFAFADGVYAAAELAPVPLPAGAVLLLTGLAGLGLARRRGARG